MVVIRGPNVLEIDMIVIPGGSTYAGLVPSMDGRPGPDVRGRMGLL